MTRVRLRRYVQAIEDAPGVGDSHHDIDVANGRNGRAMKRHCGAPDDPPRFERVGRQVRDHRQCFCELGRQIHG